MANRLVDLDALKSVHGTSLVGRAWMAAVADSPSAQLPHLASYCRCRLRHCSVLLRQPLSLRRYGIEAAAFRTRACPCLGSTVPCRSGAELPRTAHRAKPLLASPCAARGVAIPSSCSFLLNGYATRRAVPSLHLSRALLRPPGTGRRDQAAPKQNSQRQVIFNTITRARC